MNKPLKDKFEDQCMVCGYDDYEEQNKILYCDGCDIGVHQQCYGLSTSTMKMEPKYYDFTCWSCKAFQDSKYTMALKCYLCDR